MFDALYVSRPADRIVSLGDYYRPPEKFEHGREHLVATLHATGGDGHDVKVLETRLPARFFIVCAAPTTDSIGRHHPGFTLRTGSDMCELAGQIAIAIADGMLELA